MAAITKRQAGGDQYYGRVASFNAPSKINCVDVGVKSLQVLATGNSDRDVSLFSIKSPNPSMTLTGHQSSVESVKFDEEEETVLAGSLGGVIKAWDLHVPKFLCSLRGHAGPVKCLDTYRPHYVASGSVDAYVKIWDLRTEGSCFTYAGHERAVTSVRFCPNGSWLVSTSSDGTAKIWDLIAGRLLQQFASPRFGLNYATFHPHELLLATASGGGEVFFYELEHFNEVSVVQAPPGVHHVFFDVQPEQQQIYALSSARLSVLSWEPSALLDQKPFDAFSPPLVCPQQLAKFGSPEDPHLILTDIVDNVLGAYLLPPVTPFQTNMPVAPQAGIREPNQPCQRSSRRSFAESDRGFSIDLKLNANEGSVQRTDALFEDLPDERGAIFVPSKTLPRSPPNGRKVEPSPTHLPQPNTRPAISRNNPLRVVVTEPTLPSQMQNLSVQSNLSNAISPNIASGYGSPIAQSTPVHSRANASNSGQPEQPLRKLSTSQRAPHQPPITSNSYNFPPRDAASPRTRTIATVIPQRPQCTSGTQTTPKSTPDECPKLELSVPHDAHASNKSDLSNASSFSASQQYSDAVFGSNNSSPSQIAIPASPSRGATEDDVLQGIKRNSGIICNGLEQTDKLWNNSLGFWRREGAKGAFEYAQMSGNLAFEADMLALLAKRRQLWTLDLCSMVLPRIRYLLTSQSSVADEDRLVDVAIPCLRVVLNDFAVVLKQGIRTAPTIGVDISQDERRAKCSECLRELAEIKHWIGSPTVKRRNNVFLDEIGLLLRAID